MFTYFATGYYATHMSLPTIVVGDSLLVVQVCKSYLVTFVGCETLVNFNILNKVDFDVNLGMH